MIDEGAFVQLLPRPWTLSHDFAQGFRPQAVGSITLLSINATPRDAPPALLGLAPQFFGESRFADAHLTEEQYALWTTWHLRWAIRCPLAARRLSTHMLLGHQ